MNLEGINHLIEANNEELNILNSMAFDSDIEEKNVLESVDAKEIITQIRRLNPGIYIQLDGSNACISSLSGNDIKLPDGFEYNDKNGITNKHHTKSGSYVSIDVRPLDKSLQDKVNEYKDMSNNALQERKTFLKEYNSKLISLRDNGGKTIEEINKLKEELDEAKKNKDNNKVLELNKRLKEKRSLLRTEKKKIYKDGQGQTKEVLSCVFGQVNKRVHNVLCGTDEKSNLLQNANWKAHSWWRNFRYEHPVGYLLVASAVTIGLFASTAAMFSAALPVAFGITGAYVASAATKICSMAYNLIKYGDMPKTQRHKVIRKGNYLDNIKNALFTRKNIKSVNKNITFIKHKKNVNKNDDLLEKNRDENLNEYREKLNNLDISSIKANELDEERANELNKIVTSLISNKDSLTPDEQTKLDTLSNIIKEYFENIKNFNKDDAVKVETENEEKENEKVVVDKKANVDFVVRDLIERVGKLDANNLDALEVESLLNILNGLNNNQKNQVPQSVYLVLGKAKNLLMKDRSFINNKNTKEEELNKLIESIDLDKVKQFLKGRILGNLRADEKQNLYKVHDELAAIRNVLSIVSSERVKNTSLDGKNIAKLSEMIRIFGKDNSRVNNVLPNKVEINLYDVADKTGRNFAGYSAVCKFYKDNEFYFERTMFVENDDEKYLEDLIKKEVHGFEGEVVVNKSTKRM